MEEDNAENLREKIQRELNLFERAEYVLETQTLTNLDANSTGSLT